MSTAPLELTDTLGAVDWEPEYACEHPHHQNGARDSHDGGPGTHWATTTHACFGPVGVLYPVCTLYAADKAGTWGLTCHWCNAPITQRPVRILGPIKTA